MAILGKAGSVLEALEGGEEISVQRLAEITGEPLSSTYRLLASLAALGWVDPGSRRSLYRLGVGMLRVGSAFEDGLNLLDVCRPTLLQLRAELQITSFLCVRHGAKAVCVDRLASRNVQSLALKLGGSLPLHSGAAPLAILAFLPAEEREAVLDELASSEGDVPSRDSIQARIAATRQRGYSLSDEDVTVGIAAIGAPVFNHRGELEAAISVSGLREHLLADLEQTSGIVRAGALACSRALGYREQG